MSSAIVEYEATYYKKELEIERGGRDSHNMAALIKRLEFLDLGVPEAIQHMDFSVTWASKFPLLLKLVRV